KDKSRGSSGCARGATKRPVRLRWRRSLPPPILPRLRGRGTSRRLVEGASRPQAPSTSLRSAPPPSTGADCKRTLPPSPSKPPPPSPPPPAPHRGGGRPRNGGGGTQSSTSPLHLAALGTSPVNGGGLETNLLALAIEAARADATLGEISAALEAAFGRYGTQP